MSFAFRLKQAVTIARMELKRVFFSKRSFWVYLLALFPAVVFFAHGVVSGQRASNFKRNATVTDARKLDEVRNGETVEDVRARLGRPVEEYEYGNGRQLIRYWDGQRQVDLNFRHGSLIRKRSRSLMNEENDRTAYAAVFQYFYLRLAIFFGCLGIFMNLFRGEMLDKTLHFWFLAPARREVLLAGKYLAGLVTALTVFVGGTVLSFMALLWGLEDSAAARYWSGDAPSHLLSYAGSAALACLGYGSVFLAAGLLMRNPIVPAVVIELWESVNAFLPVWLQKLSVLYYAQSVCPTAAPVEAGTPALLQMLIAPAEPATPLMATLGLLAVTALVLWMAARAVARLEINYSTE